jgi:hypothetical protein
MSNKFTQAYVVAALWSSTDDSGEPLNSKYSASDIATECMERIELDCKEFQKKNGQLLAQSGLDDTRAGHCFWLNRVGHGSGFWDEYSVGVCDEYMARKGETDFLSPNAIKNCDCPYHTCQRLSDACKEFGSFDLYVGDDGKIYA